MKIELPNFQPELAKASTLPKSLYTDPAVYALEQERIFSRTWQPVGRIEQVQTPGSYFTAEVAGEPIVVVRDREGILRAFYNVCRHRAGPIAVGCGNRQSLTCRYHGWTYSLRGELRNTPEFEGVECFAKSDFGLRAVSVDTFGPIVFVNLSTEATALANVIDGIPQATARFSLERLTLCERKVYEVACNWKVYIDNYLEGYHIPIVHPALYRELDYSAYRVDTHRYYSSQHAPLRKKNASDPNATAGPYTDTTADAEALYYWVFPGWMLNVYPDNLQFNAVIPLAVDRTQVIFEWYMLAAGAMTERPVDDQTARDPEAARAAIAKGIAFSDVVQKEDIDICEAVQKGLRSRSYDRGRFCVQREHGVHHFQSLVHEFLTEQSPRSSVDDLR